MFMMDSNVIPIATMADWRLPDDQFLASFKLVEKSADRLAAQSPHPRDRRIAFNEERHEYLIDGCKIAPRSTTGFLHSFASPWNPQAALRAMKQGRQWDEKRAALEEQGLGIGDTEIMAQWERSGQVARCRGTLLHFHAEMHANGYQIEPPHSKEFSQAMALFRNLVDDLELQPYRTEMSVFHCGLRLAGQIDLLMRNPTTGEIVVVDWKRAREVKFQNSFGHLQYPLQHLPDANGWLYCLQVNLYGYMLESEYEMTVGGHYLAVVHPDYERGRLIACPNMKREIQAVVEYEIEYGRASAPKSGADAPFEP